MTSKTIKLMLAASTFTLAAGFAGQAQATSLMQVGARTSQPIGHYELCQRMPRECAQQTNNTRPMKLTRKLWAAMIDINNAVNVMVTPRTDMEMWGHEEVWSYPNGEGDCEDYVLEKRKLLMEAGVPAGNLLITVVRQRNGEGHAVLTVKTDRGDFVLDNLEQRVLAWTDTEYQFLKRQSSKHSGAWVAIRDSRSVVTGSVSK